MVHEAPHGRMAANDIGLDAHGAADHERGRRRPDVAAWAERK